jgi:hypothetical protein
MIGLQNSQPNKHPMNKHEGNQGHPLASPGEIRKVQRETILKNLEHRLQVAREQGDERLVKQLEAEKRQFG